MAWTAPRTWTTGEMVTGALQNLHVRDNLTFLGAKFPIATADIAAGAVTMAKQNFLYVGLVTDAGASVSLPSGWTCARNFGTGQYWYTITHGLGDTNYAVVCQVLDTTQKIVMVINRQATYFSYQIWFNEYSTSSTVAAVCFHLVRY